MSDNQENRQRTLILVDTSALAKTPVLYNRVFSIQTAEGTYETTNLFNLFQIFKKVSSLNTMIFCCDRKTVRHDADSNYKAGRKKNTDNYKIQMKDAEHDLAECGFTVAFKDGFESDDIIAYFVDKYKDSGLFDRILVYTNDSDISNVLDKEDKVQLRKISKYSHDACASTFQDEFGIPYNTMVLYKATVGDKTDKIPGVYRFGESHFPALLEFTVNNGYTLADIRENEQEGEILKKYFKCSDSVASIKSRLSSITSNEKLLDLVNNLELNALGLEVVNTIKAAKQSLYDIAIAIDDKQTFIGFPTIDFLENQSLREEYKEAFTQGCITDELLSKCSTEINQLRDLYAILDILNGNKLAQAQASLYLATPITDGLDFEIESMEADREKVLAMLRKYEMNSIIKAAELLY